LKPDEAIFHLRLAATLEAIGEKDEARAEYEEAIKLMPGNGIPYFNLGNMMRDQGNISTALEYYATALSINLESPFRELCSKAMVGLQNSSPTTKREDNIMKEATVSMQAIKKLIEGVGRRDDLGREMSLEEMAALYTTNRLFPDDKEASLRFMQSYMKGEILVQQVGVWPSGSYKLLIP
jgi:tetratricopeptide (TPR) repeat protein